MRKILLVPFIVAAAFAVYALQPTNHQELTHEEYHAGEHETGVGVAEAHTNWSMKVGVVCDGYNFVSHFFGRHDYRVTSRTSRTIYGEQRVYGEPWRDKNIDPSYVRRNTNQC